MLQPWHLKWIFNEPNAVCYDNLVLTDSASMTTTGTTEISSHLRYKTNVTAAIDTSDSDETTIWL